MLRCRLLGHRYRFVADGDELRWHCERCLAPGGSRSYPSAALAERYARGLSRDDRADLGRRAPPFGLAPLRLLRRRKQRS
jgi:hypothetical protein